jgi:hypothetical protein
MLPAMLPAKLAGSPDKAIFESHASNYVAARSVGFPLNNPGDNAIDQGADPLSAPQLHILHQVVCALGPGLYVVIHSCGQVILQGCKMSDVKL